MGAEEAAEKNGEEAGEEKKEEEGEKEEAEKKEPEKKEEEPEAGETVEISTEDLTRLFEYLSDGGVITKESFVHLVSKHMKVIKETAMTSGSKSGRRKGLAQVGHEGGSPGP